VPVVYVSASVSRASSEAGRKGEWRVGRGGPLEAELRVRYRMSAGQFDVTREATIPAGASHIEIELGATETPAGLSAVLSLQPEAGYHIGCPSAALVMREE
jgi:hypothetical protein